MNDFRLAKDVRPSRYEIHLELDLDRWSANGSERITFRTERPARELVLHSLDLDITKAGVEGGPGGRGPRAGQGPRMTKVAYDTESQTATLVLERELAAGEHVLAIEWAGEIREALRGLYRSVRDGERYATTQFEAADARRAFPCFDEPEFKARWRIELVHPSGLLAVANAPIERQESLSDGRTLTRFAETPPFSSYLVAFSVGPFEATPEARTASGVPVRVVLPPGLAERGLYARDAHVRAIEWLEEYTGIPYPYGKVDAVGIPDYEAGAMENPGAITYRTTYLAADRATASSAMFKAIFSVVAHELTHMWWGDLVTMAWWTDLWLNESFASAVGQKATAALNPEWAYERDVVGENAGAFSLDSLVSTHPVSVEAKNADEASERFDAVTYEKGQGVLRMLENFLGADTFRDGVRIYLRRHREANATADDFWRALSEASGRDVTRIANAWITEPGHPLVHCAVTEQADGLTVELRQQRFLADPGAAPSAQRWPVPLVIKHGGADGVRTERVLLESERATVRLSGARWYYPNGGGLGFYRFALDDRSAALLAANVGALAAEERLALLDDQWALVRASKTGVAQLVELIAGLGAEDDRAVLAQISAILGALDDDAVRPATEAAFRGFVDRIFRPQLEKLGWDVRADDSTDERQKRSLAIHALGSLAAAADVRREARRRVDAHLAGSARLDAEIAGAALFVAAIEGDAALQERYIARMRTTAATDAQEEARLRYALADFADPALVARYAGAIFTDLIRDQDRSLVYYRLMGARASREIAWTVLRQHWDSHVARMDPHTKQRAVEAVGLLTVRALEREAIAFLKEKETPDLKETVAQALERIRIRTANAERMAAELGDALGRVAQTVA